VVLPVFDLAAIIGYAREGEAPRWFVSSKGAAPVAFAFAEFDGYVEVPLSQVRPATGPETRSPHLHEVLHDRDVLRGVVSLASIVGRLNDRPAVAVSGKER
jgi:chemotaxis signal transduction protein